MCGIVGIFSFEGPPPFAELWPGFLSLLGHRGPDEAALWSDGPFFLGHRRLSILDLDKGGQPMALADGSLVVVLNGEIYNFVELREELTSLGHLFRTRSDTEVLLAGYREWGLHLLPKLSGMFAFALADRRNRKLLLARDRFGEKPLFLRRTGSYLAFASEVRPLAAMPDLSRKVDVEALSGFLALNYTPGRRSLLAGIERLDPGSYILVGVEGERGGRYWSPPKSVDQSRSASIPEAIEEFDHLFSRAVRNCLRSDVPVGVLLSGGMDSSLVAHEAVRQGNLSAAYFLDFSDETFSERKAAAAVAGRLGLKLHTVTLDPGSLSCFFDLVDHADDPLADSSALAYFVLSRLASSGNKVVLGGDGGDELFGGYLTYLASLIHKRIISVLPDAFRRTLAAVSQLVAASERKVSLSYKLVRFLRAASLPTSEAHFSWNGSFMPEDAAALLLPGAARQPASCVLARIAALHELSERPSLLDLQRADIGGYLPDDILVKGDRMSMAHGLEVRSPFLEPDLASWILTRPDSLKISARGELKVLLRAAARRVFGPAIADRPKQGFSIPIHTWVRGPMAEMVLDLLSPASVGRTGLLDPVAVRKVVSDHMSRRRSLGFEIWGLCVLMAWHRLRIEHPPVIAAGGEVLSREF